MSVGASLKLLREKSGLSIAEAAGRSKLTESFLTDVEADRVNPGEYAVAELAKDYAARIAGASSDAPQNLPAGHERAWETRPCTVRGCVDGQHQYCDGEKDDMCFSIGIGHGENHEHFWVAGYRDEQTGLWAAFSEDVDLGTLDGAEGLVMVEKLALAYRAVHEHCEALNASLRDGGAS